MKKQLDIKKLLILNLPYLLMGLFATNFGEAWRMAQGADASAKMLSFFSTLPVALASWWPSLHPLDLLVGLCCGAGLRLAVYLKSKNAKKYRHGMEYGSARWGTHEDIAPYVDPVFQNNVILTKTESLTMNSRPKDPKTARNKNVLVIGGSGSGKTRFWLATLGLEDGQAIVTALDHGIPIHHLCGLRGQLNTDFADSAPATPDRRRSHGFGWWPPAFPASESARC